MSKLERLLKLLAVLLDTHRPLSAEEIRQRIGGYPEAQASFRRAFERDKDDLRTMGVNIRVETVPEVDPPLDGYRVDADEYAGRDPGLEPDELAALHLAAALVRVDSAGEDAFWKLGGNPSGAEDPAAVAVVETPREAATLYTAVVERRPVDFGYRGERRRLEPSRLTFARGHWYVSGFDRLREADRVFRLDRIEEPIEVGEADAFAPSAARGPELTRTWELGDAAPRTARVVIDVEEAVWARVNLRPDEIVESRPDGSVVVELTVRDTDAFRDWILGFLDHAEVLEPVELRDHVVGWLEALA